MEPEFVFGLTEFVFAAPQPAICLVAIADQNWAFWANWASKMGILGILGVKSRKLAMRGIALIARAQDAQDGWRSSHVFAEVNDRKGTKCVSWSCLRPARTSATFLARRRC